MTDDTQSRLNAIERLLQESTEQTNRNAALLSQFTDVLNQTIQVTANSADAINGNAQAINQLTTAVVTDRQRFDEHQRTTEAALSKIDRVLDYLIKRDTTDHDD